MYKRQVYTLVFGAILPMRWPDTEHQGMGMFALRLLAAILVHSLLADALGRAPTAIIGQPNYVTKVVFPLEVLGWVNVLSALFHAAMGLVVLLLLNGLWGSGFSVTQLAAPLVFVPFALLVLGLVWLVSALGVYLRDIGQLVGPLVAMAMFLGPVFYPREAMPAAVRPWVALNPITAPVEQLRRVVFQESWPDWAALAQYSLACIAVYLFGLWVFDRLKRGFADVL